MLLAELQGAFDAGVDARKFLATAPEGAAMDQLDAFLDGEEEQDDDKKQGKGGHFNGILVLRKINFIYFSFKIKFRFLFL